MKAFSGPTRIAFLVFFITHIPITLFIDSQALLPEWLFPEPLKDLLDTYVSVTGDPLMARPTFGGLWFQSLIACELRIQLPFSFVAVRKLLSKDAVWQDWFRSACLVYAAHTVTTMVPIITVLLANPETGTAQKTMTFAIYFPWTFFPAWLLFLAAKDSSKTKTD